MKTVWKYELAITDLQLVAVPSDFEILSAQPQGESLCVWILVDPESEKINRLFEIKGAGHELEDKKRTFIDTFQMSLGLVFHVFLREAG